MREASSINFRRSIRYRFGCLGTRLRYRTVVVGFASGQRNEKEGLLCRGKEEYKSS